MSNFVSLFSHKPLAANPMAWLAASSAALAPAPARTTARLYSAAGSSAPRVDLCDWRQATLRAEDWADLVSRCLEPNVFMEPAFALAHAQHSPATRRPSFLFVADADRGQLIGVFALSPQRRMDGRVARLSCPNLAASGVPLLDRARAGEALDAALSWLARREAPASGVLFPMLPADGRTARLLRERVATRGFELRRFGAHARAALPAAESANPQNLDVAPKKLKELRRLRRRLEEKGAVAWTTAVAPDEVRAALERFLALESRGWKGARGTALLSEPATATFARAMSRMLSRDGRCRIDSLELDGRPVAMGVTLVSGGRAAFWKIAFDEDFAAFSPGALFTLEYTRRRLADRAIAFTDSCAAPDHPMIDRLWAGRLLVEDLLVSLESAPSPAFAAASRREDVRRRARGAAKRVYLALRRGKSFVENRLRGKAA
jgi:CelD/BcsL family acetyltransferase involved in cellulose biosynthesis